MDSMCSVRNLAKGGGPVEELVKWVKVVWMVCRRLNVTLVPRWQRRNELMMQRVDVLSKTGTTWLLQFGWVRGMEEATGVTPLLPDLSRCGPTVKAAISRKGERSVLVLPRWEGKTWWGLAIRCASSNYKIVDKGSAISPNTEMGMPRWDFHVFIFN